MCWGDSTCNPPTAESGENRDEGPSVRTRGLGLQQPSHPRQGPKGGRPEGAAQTQRPLGPLLPLLGVKPGDPAGLLVDTIAGGHGLHKGVAERVPPH